jgi:hypothetical protein
VAVSSDLDGLDDLAGSGTAVVGAGDLTLLPAFAESHEHLMEASRDTLLVSVKARYQQRSSPRWWPRPPGMPDRGRRQKK